MAKAVIPLSRLAEKWNIDPRNIRMMNRRTQLEFAVRPANGGEAEERAFTPRTLGLYPTQLYESVSMFLVFLLLTAYYPFRRRDGQVMVLLMVCYAVHRYLNEIDRRSARVAGDKRRYYVPRIDGAEMRSRWDMQAHPPDVAAGGSVGARQSR